MAQYINIDTTDNTDQVVAITLESNIYWFRLRYNDYSNWQLSVYDYNLYDKDLSDNTPAKLYGERRLMPSENYFKYTNNSASLPAGRLYLYDSDEPSTQDYELPTRYNLGQGKRFLLVYFTEDEIATYGDS